MILRELFESKRRTVGIIFGRFNPPHQGHKAAWEMASKTDYWYVGTNKSTQGPKDPLPYNIKVEAMTAIWPPVAEHIIAETSWLTLASHCYNMHKDADELICFTDEDWVTKAIIQYNGKEGAHGFYNFKSIRQAATPRLSSATALRAAVQAGDRDAFAKAAGVPADTPVAGNTFFDVVAHYLGQQTKVGTAPKRPARTGARPNRGHEEEPRYKDVAEGSLEEYGDTAQGQKMLTKVQKRAVDRVVSKKADTDPKYAKKNSDTANRAWDRMTDLDEGDVVQFPKKHKGDLDSIDDCPKCGGDLQGGKYMGHQVKVCMPCKQVYLPPNSGIDHNGNKIDESLDRIAQDLLNPSGREAKKYADFDTARQKRRDRQEKDAHAARANRQYSSSRDAANKVKDGVTIKELSNEKLAQYKKAAAADARKADAEGDYERGNKRFKGINRATMKQFDNDAKENAWDRLQREKALESAGVGIITKQNSTVDVNKNTPKKNLKAFRLI